MFYTHHLNPFLIGPFTLGQFHNIGIRWYSLAYIFGFLSIYGVLYKAVSRRRLPNADLERLEEACLIVILSVIVGGRVGYFVLNEPQRLTTLAGWLEVPQVWRGGMAFFGAAFCLFTFEYLYCRKHHIGFWHGADRMVWVLAFALGFGRCANFINGELYGVPTNGHWGVYFPVDMSRDLVHGINVPRHPIQLYAAVSHWLLGFYLLWVLRRKPRTPFDRVPGFTCFHFLCGYGLLRFSTDFWRQESIWIGPLNGGQWLSLALFFVGLGLARWRFKAFTAVATEIDWYPPEGVDGELPVELHAYIDGVHAAQRAAEAEAAGRPASG